MSATEDTDTVLPGLTLSRLNISQDPSLLAHHMAQPFVALQASQQPSPKAETLAVPTLSPLNWREVVCMLAQSACRIRALALLFCRAATKSRHRRARHCMQVFRELDCQDFESDARNRAGFG
jgi:hypothetical protein